ncbi:MAG: type III-B CRISPR module-associated Cmr3 family protein [Methylococcaceae bacterium]|nr:type III-B CRISPR module-associated Cmr3 family protein [Methylococcaceae bacterium]
MPNDAVSQQTWWIEPRSPLVFRTGRVGLNGNAGRNLYAFPLPGTVAGAVRAAYADANGWFEREGMKDSHEDLVRAISVEGPLLASQALEGGGLKVYFPKPADAVYLKNGSLVQLRKARPQPLGPGEGCDLPHPKLEPVSLDTPELVKPIEFLPFWHPHIMEKWLLGEQLPEKDPESWGKCPLPQSLRTHVQIDRARRAHKDEGLFESAGLDFAPRLQQIKTDPHWDHQYGLLVRATVGESLGEAIHGHVGRFGADGRTARFASANEWPAIGEKLSKALSALKPGSRFRLVLVTPAIFQHGWRSDLRMESTRQRRGLTAIFQHGWRPDWLDEHDLTGTLPGLPGVKVRLVAAALDRWQPYSGWDMEEKKVRAIRRLVPAGSVYWFELVEGNGAELTKLWLAPIGAAKSDGRDGFGLVLPGLERNPELLYQ